MKAILSCTDNPLYSFFLPIVTWSWKKIGIDSIVFVPEKQSESFRLAAISTPSSTRFETLNIESEREPTYFQCVRLFAGALDYIDDDETLITSDVDMAVFRDPSWAHTMSTLTSVGYDLVNDGQYPMCYAVATKATWNHIMGINDQDYKTCVGNLLDSIQCENMRGNMWCKDQETLFNKVTESGVEVRKIDRRKSDQNRTARMRADRDGWQYNANDIIDAHLPRPGYELQNFEKILRLLKDVYPSEHFGWLTNYRNAFITLLKK